MKNYPIDKATISQIDIQTAIGNILNGLFLYSIPWKFIGRSIDQLFDSTGVIGDIL